MSIRGAIHRYLHGPDDPLHYRLLGFKPTDQFTYHIVLNEMIRRIVDLEEKVKQLESSD